jgi:hypothetical protein
MDNQPPLEFNKELNSIKNDVILKALFGNETERQIYQRFLHTTNTHNVNALPLFEYKNSHTQQVVFMTMADASRQEVYRVR